MSTTRRTPMSQLARRLRGLTAPLAKNYPRGEKQARVVAVASQKGGVGKTTTAVHLAWALAEDPSQKILLVDLDPQGHVAASLRAVLGGRRGSLADVLLDREKELLDLTQPVHDESLEVVLAEKKLTEVEGILSSKIGKEFYLKKSLEITRTHYDWIILDCPPHVGELTVNALVAANEVLIPMELSALAYEGVRDVFEVLSRVSEHLNPYLGVLGIVLTSVDARTRAANAQVLEQLEQSFGPVVLETQIPINAAVRQAQHAGLPLFKINAAASAAKAYRALATELIGHEADSEWWA